MKADKIIFNCDIYTSSEAGDHAEAAAIKGNAFVHVGTLTECEAWSDSHTEMIDLEGAFVLPGLIDGHTHPETVSKGRWFVQMPEFGDKKELLEWVKKYCDEHPKEELPYFYGESYPSTLFDEKGPRKEWLDEYVSDRPVKLMDFSDHSCWLNTRAIELMGLTAENTDPKYYDRDENGLTGRVFEPLLLTDDEERLYQNLGWYPPEKITEEMMSPFLEKLSDWGVIALMDGFTEGEEAMKFFYEMDKAGKLKLYYRGMRLLEDYSQLDQVISECKEWQKKYTSDHVGIHTVKFFLDQTNEIGNSALIEPHMKSSNKPDYGVMNMTLEQLTDCLIRLNEAELDFHLHVVGDRSFRTACDAYEIAKNHVEKSGGTWKIYMELAHCELVHPDDRKRPAELGIIINWTCHWAGGFFGDASKEYLGEERFNSMYDFSEMIETGAVMTYSSDVTGVSEEHRANPFFGMEISATRIDIEEPLDPAKYPGSERQPESAKLEVSEMIRGYTRYGAIPLRLADKIGTIQTGKRANLIVLNEDIFKAKPKNLHKILPAKVMFDGEFIR